MRLQQQAMFTAGSTITMVTAGPGNRMLVFHLELSCKLLLMASDKHVFCRSINLNMTASCFFWLFLLMFRNLSTIQGNLHFKKKKKKEFLYFYQVEKVVLFQNSSRVFYGIFTHFYLKNNSHLKHRTVSSEACKKRSQSLHMQMPLSVFYLCWRCLLIKRLVEGRRALKEAASDTPARSPSLYVNTCSFYSLLTFNLPVVHFYSFCSFAIQQDPALLFQRTDCVSAGDNLHRQRSEWKYSWCFCFNYYLLNTDWLEQDVNKCREWKLAA